FTTRRVKKLAITSGMLTPVAQAAAKKPKSAKPVYTALGVPTGTIVISCGKGEVVCPGVNAANPTKNSWYLFKYHPNNPTSPIPEMTGKDLKLSGTRADIDQTQGPVVLMQFTGHGAKVFGKITADEAHRGRIVSATAGQKVLQHFAI